MTAKEVSRTLNAERKKQIYFSINYKFGKSIEYINFADCFKMKNTLSHSSFGLKFLKTN